MGILFGIKRLLITFSLVGRKRKGGECKMLIYKGLVLEMAERIIIRALRKREFRILL